MQHDVEITAMIRTDRPRRNKKNDKVIAHMTVRIGPVELANCAFVQRQNGYRTIWPPQTFQKSVTILDHETKKQIISCAEAAFAELEGALETSAEV